MQHNLSLTIDINTEAIKSRVEKDGYDHIMKTLLTEAKSEFPKKWWADEGIDWYVLINRNLGNFIEAHREEIIEAAAKRLAENYKKSKVYKEKMKEAMEGLNEQIRRTKSN